MTNDAIDCTTLKFKEKSMTDIPLKHWIIIQKTTKKTKAVNIKEENCFVPSNTKSEKKISLKKTIQANNQQDIWTEEKNH